MYVSMVDFDAIVQKRELERKAQERKALLKSEANLSSSYAPNTSWRARIKVRLPGIRAPKPAIPAPQKPEVAPA